MGRTVKLNQVDSLFAGLEYPVTREEASTRFSDVTLELADGQENLGDVLSRTNSDTFDGSDELYAELNNTLPLEAVGEPGQSDGDA